MKPEAKLVREMIQSGLPAYCPECDVSFIGDPIPEEYHHYYRPPYYYNRVIGVEEDNDRIEYWRCPDCGKEFK